MRDRKGFTLNELTIVFAIVAILASVVLVYISDVRQKARDLLAMESVSVTPGLASKCLNKNFSNVQITHPTESGVTSMCRYVNGGWQYSNDISNWPSLGNTGWSYSNFAWCDPISSGSSRPGTCSPYSDSCGGSNTSLKFCYMLCDQNCSSATKFIWCTNNGCNREGF